MGSVDVPSFGACKVEDKLERMGKRVHTLLLKRSEGGGQCKKRKKSIFGTIYMCRTTAKKRSNKRTSHAARIKQGNIQLRGDPVYQGSRAK